MALPGIGFDAVRYESRRAEKTGNILIEGNTYAAGPAFASRTLTVGLRHDVVEILDEQAAPVLTFGRVFGRQSQTVFEPATLLPLLVRKPGAWSHSPLREVVPDPVRDWLDSAGTAERRRLLNAVDAATGPAGFESAIQAAETLIRHNGTPDPAALAMLARRIADGAEPAAAEVDLGVYDNLVAAAGELA